MHKLWGWFQSTLAWLSEIGQDVGEGLCAVGGWLWTHAQIVLTFLAVIISLVTVYYSVRVEERVYAVGFRFETTLVSAPEEEPRVTINAKFQMINAGNRPAVVERSFLLIQQRSERSCRDPSLDMGIDARATQPGEERFLDTVVIQPSAIEEIEADFPNIVIDREVKALCLTLMGYDFQGRTRFVSSYIADANRFHVMPVNWPQRVDFIQPRGLSWIGSVLLSLLP